MEDTLIYSNAAVELLEILRYVDVSIRKKIPYKVEENLNRIKNQQYHFKIDKTKPLKEQVLMKEIKEILSIMYLKYCCSPDEANELIKENQQRADQQSEICEKYNPSILFNQTKIAPKSTEEITKEKQLMPTETIPWYKKIIQKIKKLFRR